ncbi:MAG: hypothetical protein ACOH1J_07595 [Microbacteriaceae bacterium]
MKQIAIYVLAGVLMAIAGCSTYVSSEDTLSSTKPPTQLIRNTVADLVPFESVDARETATDTSVSCSADANDSERSWLSSIRLIMTPEYAAKSEEVGAVVIDELRNLGWDGEESSDNKSFTWRLSKGELDISLVVTAIGDPDGNGKGASILIESTGPCVMTDGVDSTEVVTLENQ